MTDRFVTAADEMRRVLGVPEYPFAVMEHPISSASDAALERQAEALLKRSVGLLSAPEGAVHPLPGKTGSEWVFGTENPL